ncbi:MAG: DMT family transporter [Actinomycetes bacterium]|jgi:drug/metabolite transporter (DMT)-like permease
MAAILALFSSLLWGSADFMGGNLSKRFKPLAVTGASQTIGLATGIFLILVTNGWRTPTFTWHGYLLPGICAGFLGFFGLTAFYAGLSTGRMGVVSPISSLSALIPLGVAVFNGERPKALQLIGMAIALAGAFCSSGPEIAGGVSLKPLLLGLCAAFGFGTALTFMAMGSKTSSLMTMTTMRVFTVLIVSLLALRYRTIGGFAAKDFRWLIAIGISDYLANFLLGLATTKGLVSVAMVLGSLFPIVTSVLAFRFLHERLHKVQYLGIFLAIFGVALISVAA